MELRVSTCDSVYKEDIAVSGSFISLIVYLIDTNFLVQKPLNFSLISTNYKAKFDMPVKNIICSDVYSE